MTASLTALHTRSGYSLLCGAVTPGRLVDRARSLGYAGLALTDINGLCGASAFYHQAERAGLRPILGAELVEGAHQAVALVAESTGYKNLCRLLTRLHRRKGESSTSEGLPADLAEHSQGLHIVTEDPALAQDLRAEGVPSDRLWLEFDPASQPHRHVRHLLECAERTDLPLLATGKGLFLEAEDLDVIRLLTAIRRGQTYDDIGPEQLPSPAALLRAPSLLRKQLAAFPQALRNNQRLAEQCDSLRLPRRPVFPRFQPPRGERPSAYLRRLCRGGVRRRYNDEPPPGAEKRLRRELELIERLGFCEYFLVVWRIVRYARRRRVPVAGRGSGASSLVAYLLGITNVCPLAFNIPFERFLHEGRDDFPDLDIDFCWRIRDEVIQYVIEKWGTEHTAMVSTHNKFQPRSALRETAKAFGLSDKQISRMLRDGPGERDTAPIARLSRRIVDLPHLLSLHPGGIVITPEPIDQHVPVQLAPKGVSITQYDKDGVEDFGLVKLDLLGNRNLSTVRSASQLLSGRGRRIDIESLPPNDPDTIELLRDADTVGCNQLESPAMRNLLTMLRPSDVRDVMKALALIRPGAAGIGMKQTFIRRHRGLEPPSEDIPAVRAVLGDTYGVMLYEDDVMLTAAAMTGAPLVEADRFRRAVQNCRTDTERISLTREFLHRCEANGVDVEYAKSIWVQMAKFNAYSFCRAHAASYAQLAYAGAYLKAHYPLAFWTAALNNNQSMYPTRVYVEQAKRRGIRFLPPNVNRSGAEFTIEGDAIRVGLGRIESLGPTGVQAILEARDARPIRSVSDLLARTDLGSEEARALILSGAFDGTGRTRPELIAEMELALRARSAAAPGRGRLLAVDPDVPALPDDYDAETKYRQERRMLGFSTGPHIMTLYRAELAGKVDADSRQLGERIGRRVRIAGMLEACRTTRTRDGRMMRFLTFDDEYGLFEVTSFPGNNSDRSLARYDPYVVRGKIEHLNGSVTLSAEDIHAIKLKRADQRECRIPPLRP